MSSLPLSICIPTYNRARLLDATLTHLHDLHGLFSEIVISDNASTDDTPQVVARWQSRLGSCRYYRQPENRGALHNIFVSLSLATEDFSFVLSDDDRLIADGIVAAVSEMAADADCVAVYGGYERWDAALQVRLAVLSPHAPGRYGKDDWLALAQNTYQLTFPVLRRTVFQRHCFLDDTTLGLWRLIAQLLNHGAVRLIPQSLYRHADTAGRLEQQSHQPWYHDHLRSDWELYVASIGRLGAAAMAEFVAARTAPVYVAGQDYARERDLPLLERTFLMRHLAYREGDAATGAEARATAWETDRLIAAVIMQLADQLTADPGLRRVFVEQGRMNIVGMLEAVRRRLPDVEIVPVAPEQIAALDHRAGDLLLVEYWETLTELDGRGQTTPRRRIAVGDLIGRMRLRAGVPSPMLRGPDGSYHFSFR
jgi:hypothetical protein